MSEPDSTRRNFDEAAAKWDENPVRVALATAIAQGIKERVPLHRTTKAMEFGCGTGLVTMHIAPHVGSVCAVDGSAQMLEMLSRKAADAGFSHISGCHCDFTKDPLPEGPFDFIFTSMVLHHIEDIDGLLAAFRRALNPGGYVAIADLDAEDGSFHKDAPDTFHHGFERDALAAQLEAAGFEPPAYTTAYVIHKGPPDAPAPEYPVFLAVARVK